MKTLRILALLFAVWLLLAAVAPGDAAHPLDALMLPSITIFALTP